MQSRKKVFEFTFVFVGGGVDCTDTDCIDEICEIVAQGITATAIFIDKRKHVGLLACKLSMRKANKLFRS